MAIAPISKSGSSQVSKSVIQRWSRLIESFQDKAFIKPSKKEAFSQMLENEMKVLPNIIKENVSSASFLTGSGASALGSVPFYMGVIRRGYPKLVGMNLFGVQALSQPGGMMFAVKRTYKGKTDLYSNFKTITQFNSVVLILTATPTVALTENQSVTIKEGTTGAATIATANVVYAEDNKVLIQISAFSTGYTLASIVGGGSGVGAIVATGTANLSTAYVYDNFANYSTVFKNYSKFKDTALSLNNSEFDGTAIRDVGNDIVTVPVTNIINRKIRSKISQEVIEDMMAYKYDIQNDLMNIMLEDITAEMNREFYGYLKGGAEVFPTMDYSSIAGTTAFDKYVAIVSKATYLSTKIAVDLKTSVGNYIVISPALLAAFTSLSKYWNYTNDPSVGNLQMTQNGNFGTDPYVGRFNNMWDAYVDIFDDTDDILVGNYSENNMDNAWFYLPYIALTPDILKDPTTATWVLHYRTRYAVLQNPFGAYRWTKKVQINNLVV